MPVSCSSSARNPGHVYVVISVSLRVKSFGAAAVPYVMSNTSITLFEWTVGLGLFEITIVVAIVDVSVQSPSLQLVTIESLVLTFPFRVTCRNSSL